MKFQELKYKFPITNTEIEPGLSIAHTDMGDGEPIIFIHGLGSYIPAWDKNLEDLSRYFRCIAIDLPGYGKSTKILHNGSMEYYAEVVAKLMASLQIDSAHICGHSMGGVIALKFALSFPGKTKKLILVAPGGAEEYSEDDKTLVRSYLNAEKILENDDQQIRNNIKVNFHHFPYEAEFMISDRIGLRGDNDFHIHAQVVASSALGVMESDVPFRLKEISQDSMIFFATKDKLIPNRFVHPALTQSNIMLKFESNIRNSKIFVVPSCGHFIQFEKPDIFNYNLLRFLR